MTIKLSRILTIGFAFFLCAVSITQADSAQPQAGSADDPLVTKSYVDQAIAKLQGGPTSTPTAGGSGSTGTSTDSTLQVVTLQAGQVLMAGTGAEFIVRTGKTVAVSNDANGIPDLTAGKDLPAG